MDVLNVRWVGVRTGNDAAMARFLRDVMGLRVNFEEPTTMEFSTSEGDEIQIMAPGDPYFDFFGEHATGPVPLFEVDDVQSARRELEEAGAEIVGGLGTTVVGNGSTFARRMETSTSSPAVCLNRTRQSWRPSRAAGRGEAALTPAAARTPKQPCNAVPRPGRHSASRRCDHHRGEPQPGAASGGRLPAEGRGSRPPARERTHPRARYPAPRRSPGS
jgi:hypothetical protein